MPGACGGQKQEVGTLELELLRIVHHQMGAGNRNLLPCKSNRTPNSLAISLAPENIILQHEVRPLDSSSLQEDF